MLLYYYTKENLRSNLILVQKTSLLNVCYGVNKSLLHWPVFPTQTLQFLATQLQFLMYLCVTEKGKVNKCSWGKDQSTQLN